MKSVMRLVSVFAISALLFSACSGNSDVDAKQTVKDAMTNSNTVKSAEYDYKISAKVVDSEAAGSFDISLSGVYDMSDFSKVALSAIFDASMEDTSAGVQTVSGELRVLDNVAYGMLTKAPDLAALIDPEFQSKYVNKWFSMAIPQQYIDQLQNYSELSEEGEADAELTAEEKEIKDLIANADYIAGAKFEGSEDGLDKYSIDLDEEAIIKLAVTLSEKDGYTPSAEEQAELKTTLSDLSEGLYVWIDPATNLVNRFTGQFDVPVDSNDATAGHVTISLDLGMSNLNGEVNVEMPEGAEPFALGSLLGAPAVPVIN
jgi:hypothetical protein